MQPTSMFLTSARTEDEILSDYNQMQRQLIAQQLVGEEFPIGLHGIAAIALGVWEYLEFTRKHGWQFVDFKINKGHVWGKPDGEHGYSTHIVVAKRMLSDIDWLCKQYNMDPEQRFLILDPIGQRSDDPLPVEYLTYLNGTFYA